MCISLKKHDDSSVYAVEQALVLGLLVNYENNKHLMKCDFMYN